MVSIKELKKYTHLSKPTWLVKYAVFFAPYIMKLLLYTSITANQVSFLMIPIALIACVLFSFGEFWFSIIGIILLHLLLVLDAVDGAMARYKGTMSIKGVFLDLVVHSINEPLIYFGLTLGVFRNTNSMTFLIFGMLAVIFSFLVLSVQHLKNHTLMIKLVQYAKGKKLEELEGKNFDIGNFESEYSRKFSFLKKIIKKGMFYLIFHYVAFVLIFSVIFNFTQWVLVFYGIALPLKWLIIMIYEFKVGYKPLEYLFRPYQQK